MDYTTKAKLLRKHGWRTLWSDDNWVEGDNHSQIDKQGLDTDKAYRLQIKRNNKGNLNLFKPSDFI